MCPNASDNGSKPDKWLSVFAPPIAKRLNKWAPGANLTSKDAHSLMSLCAFETLYAKKASPFCALFDDEEWDAFEYHGDLEKFYKTG